MFEIDHIAITCSDLDSGCAFAAALFGVPLSPGGQHGLMGTYNRLLSLGPGEYLEVIAPDPSAPVPAHPRWFGLDRPAAPRLGAWIARVPDLDRALAKAPPGAGQATALERGDLRWKMGIAPSGLSPFDGVHPWLIEWQGAAHPAQRLPDYGVRLIELRLSHPEPEALRAALALDDPRLVVVVGPPGLSARLSTPAGEVAL